MVGDRSGARRAAFRRLAALAHVVNGLVRAVAADDKQQFRWFRRADPIELGPVKLHFLAADQLIHIDSRIERTQRESIWFGDVVDIIGRNDGTRARHVLHRGARIAGNILSQILRHMARPEVVEIAGLSAADDADRLTLEKVGLGVRGNAESKGQAPGDDKKPENKTELSSAKARRLTGLLSLDGRGTR